MKRLLHTSWPHIGIAIIGPFFCGLLVTTWALADPRAAANDGATDGGQTGSDPKPVAEKGSKGKAMQVFYLEIVTKEVDAVCAAYTAANGVEFGKPVAGLGNARTAPMPGGGWVGVRAPLRDTEHPVVRPYWLVDDIKAAVAAVVESGGEIAHPPLEIPGYGTFAIYFQGGVEHGLWQR